MLSSSCFRVPSTSTTRLAILPANVLLTEASSEWLRSAIPIVLQRDLSRSEHFAVSTAGDESSVYRLGSAEVLRVTVQEGPGGLEMDSTITDIATQRNRGFISVRGSDLLTELNHLAAQIDSRATPFSTRSEKALGAFSAAVSSPDVQVRIQKLRDAIAVDPSFGAAYCALANTLATLRSSDTSAVLSDGQSRRASFTVLDRAQFDLVRARLLPAPLNKQVETAAALVKLTPNDADALGSLASLLFLEGQSGEAQRTMARAIQIRPDNVSLREQLATGLIESKQFGEAEKVLTGLMSDARGVSQLAFCALLSGDTSRANEIYEKFLTTVANPALKTFLEASWQASTGHLDQAIQQLGGTHFSDPRLSLLARNQVILWQIMAKRSGDAKVMAAGGAGPLAMLLASGAPSAEAWRSKVESFPDESAKNTLRAYGLFLYGFYEQAAESWKAIEDASGGTDLRARAMLAASLRLAGKTEEARKILVQPFIPDFSDYYAAVSFTQLRLLLGQAG